MRLTTGSLCLFYQLSAIVFLWIHWATSVFWGSFFEDKWSNFFPPCLLKKNSKLNFALSGFSLLYLQLLSTSPITGNGSFLAFRYQSFVCLVPHSIKKKKVIHLHRGCITVKKRLLLLETSEEGTSGICTGMWLKYSHSSWIFQMCCYEKVQSSLTELASLISC